MSLESALDEERREILKLLEGPTQQRPQRAVGTSGGVNRVLDEHGRASSPQGARSPVRSMLDVVDASSAPRHASVAGSGAGITPAPTTQARNGVRSMLDPPAAIRSMLDPPPKPLPRPVAHAHSVTTSPTTEAHPHDTILHRSRSDASSHPLEPGTIPGRDRDKSNANRSSAFAPGQDYQFEMLPSHGVGALPKRVTQGGKRSSFIPNSMSTVMGRGSDRGRDANAGSRGKTANSKSPPSRFGRSRSPHGNLNSNSFNPMPTPGKFVGQSGQVVDMDNAYRRLSDAYLARSGGSLSVLSARSGSQHIRADSGESLAPNGGIRLQKDYYDRGDNEAAVEESSEEDSDPSSGDDLDIEARRGRKRSRRKGGPEGDRDDSDPGTVSMGRGKGPRKTLSLLAAAEEERREVSSKYKVKSLLAPPLSDGPGDRPRKVGVHPSTSFDQGTPGGTTPVTSDTEADNSDIKRAQRMHVGISPISSTPESHRVIRTIIRGEYAKMQQEAEEGLRRQRSYLVATDLSDEAAHALEWTIGTVLRDGDTLLAIYAVNEESGTGKGAGDADSTHGVGIGEGALALKDRAAVVGNLTAKAPHAPPSPSPLSAPGIAANQETPSASPDSRQRSKAEQERYHAVEDISERCVRLVRKTRLQVRIVIEVIHCKSPKHLITEVIDFIDPTLVILGSRGRSALKGVLLGSFSNYLVTKSSVPVMVARKKLKKHSKKYKNTHVRLSNNLLPAKGLASAKID